MILLRRLAFALPLCALASGCAPPPPEAAFTRPLQAHETAGAVTHRKFIEHRPDGGEGILRLYEDGRATYAGAQAQWAAPWRIEGAAVCFGPPQEGCYDLALEKPRWFVATPRDGGAPRRWYEMKRIDEPANVRADAAESGS